MNIYQTLRTSMAGFILLAAAACSSSPSPTTTPGSEEVLVGTQWRLESFGPQGSETPIIEGTKLTLEFSEQNRMGGSGGCNTFGGEYAIQGATLDLKNITSTLMACLDEEATQQEGEYLKALLDTGRYELTGDRLTIWYADGQSVLNFTRN